MAQRGVNKVIIMGNLGQDPDVRYMPNGDAVTNISVATSEVWKDKNTGEQQERTEWHRIVLFRKQAEIVGEHFKKGSKIYIEGRNQTRSWEQDGVKRYTTEIVANEFQFVESGGGGGGDQKAQQQYQTAQGQAPTQSGPSSGQNSHLDNSGSKANHPAPPDDDFFDDDIPF